MSDDGQGDSQGEGDGEGLGREHPTVILCAGGPMLLRGDHVIEDADGVRHRTTRPVSAVCRCGKSSMQPWCDGTHKLIPDKARP